MTGRAGPGLAVGGACLLTGTLGSIHAFSVLIGPFGRSLGASQAEVGLIYSGALIALTVSVLFGHRLYNCRRPGRRALSRGAKPAEAVARIISGAIGFTLLTGMEGAAHPAIRGIVQQAGPG